MLSNCSTTNHDLPQEQTTRSYHPIKGWNITKNQFLNSEFSKEKLSPFLVQLLPLVTDLADFPEEEKNKFVPVVSILINIPKNWESYYDKTLMQINRVISELFFI